MRRVLLSPKWLVGHAVVITLAVLFGRLAWWQWDRSHALDGGAQNIGYALQWPLFAGFGVALWVRIVRDALRPPAGGDDARRRPAGPDQTRRRRTGVGTRDVTAARLAADERADPALAAYNRYLATLHERAEPARSAGPARAEDSG